MQGDQISVELRVTKAWDGQYRLEAQRGCMEERVWNQLVKGKDRHTWQRHHWLRPQF